MRKSTIELSSFTNKSLRARVADVLRDAIFSGELQPGTSLVETDLASQLGVSRAPVREALQILEGEGLVEIIPYHGTKVHDLTKRDVEELYSLRTVLESFAVQCLIQRGDAEGVAQLRKIYELMLKVREGDFKRINELDRVFHDRLIELAQHQLLANTWNTVAMRVRQVMALRNLQNNTVQEIAHNHLPIIKAIEAGDEDQAIVYLQAHIASSGDLLIEEWAQKEIE